MNLVVTGHVDHGKSTILGRLLADSGAVPDGRLDQLRAQCGRQAVPFEYAFLLDTLRDERAQGVTIDTGRIVFRSPARTYAIIDAPGHVEFLRNMLTGAARADAALLVVDARDGVRESSRRHGYLLSMLGVRQVIVAVNKMDLVDRSEAAFDRIVADCDAFLRGVGLVPVSFVPVSGLTGENLITRSVALPWYHGPTLIDALDGLPSRPAALDAPFRMPVQDVYRFAAVDDQRRIVAGTVASGVVRAGDALVFLPSGRRSSVRAIETFGGAPPAEAGAGEATGFTLTDPIYVTRGELAARADERLPLVSTRVRASVFWLGSQALAPGTPYLLKLGTARVTARVEAIHRVTDTATLDSTTERREVARHEVADCTLSLSAPLAFDSADALEATSRFVLVDDHRIAGAGRVCDALRSAASTGARATGVAAGWDTWAEDKVLQSERTSTTATLAPAVVWLTGLSGAGKSTIGEALRDRLLAIGARVEYLDGDALRDAFPGTGFTRDARDAHVRRVGYLASRLEHHDVIVICALISPYEEARQFVRGQCRRFIEVHVATPLDECERRDPKGLYARARRGELTRFTGIDDPYEAPTMPEVTIDTRVVPVAAAVDRIAQALMPNRAAERRRRR